ncbi:unnamed protein product [Cyprideis torosa]|uniref:Uncharacterized protein n=1 Tax=Cyprideis torosa TaxID=163714 RepID=A0A7R8WFC6_9CRUS|nr:unnamed protein product [Cyprideis torosa]CAG0893957.1 unnamed protein product [Cyprideis torosa]
MANASPNVTMENSPTYEGQCDHPFTAVNGGRCYFPSYDLLKTTRKEAQVICTWLHPEGQLAEFETLPEIVDATGFLINDNSTHGCKEILAFCQSFYKSGNDHRLPITSDFSGALDWSHREGRLQYVHLGLLKKTTGLNQDPTPPRARMEWPWMPPII